MLDPRGRKGLMRVCRELHDRGMTVVMITHFMEEAAQADRVIVLEDGHVACDGAPQDVLVQAELLERLNLDLPFAAELSLELQRRGVRVPQDMQVIGFDNVPDAEYCMPGLTTIDPHVDDYARHAVDMLIARIEGSADPFRTYVTSYDLVRRASTC